MKGTPFSAASSTILGVDFFFAHPKEGFRFHIVPENAYAGHLLVEGFHIGHLGLVVFFG